MQDLVFGTFKIDLQNTLNNLYNPAYEHARSVLEVTGCSITQGLDCVREKIIKAIYALHSESSLPTGSKSRMFFELLDYHFVQSFSQEKTAERLGISARHVRRLQQQAIHALALQLWNKISASTESQDPKEERITAGETEESWKKAALQEIMVLQSKFPGVSSNLREVMQKVTEMVEYLIKDPSFQVEILPIEDDLEIPIHPNILSQIVMIIIDQICHSGSVPSVTVAAHSEQEVVTVTFSVCQPDGLSEIDIATMEGLVGELGADVKIRSILEQCSMELIFAQTQKIKVLVIDDNPEIFQLYQRYTANTRYELVHLPSGDNLLEMLELHQPNVLVMDILLPGYDGWDLLIKLNDLQLVQRFPVVICSVMGNEHVARSLGASYYLPKPVEQKTFLNTLDQVIADIS